MAIGEPSLRGRTVMEGGPTEAEPPVADGAARGSLRIRPDAVRFFPPKIDEKVASERFL